MSLKEFTMQRIYVSIYFNQFHSLSKTSVFFNERIKTIFEKTWTFFFKLKRNFDGTVLHMTKQVDFLKDNTRNNSLYYFLAFGRSCEPNEKTIK